MDPSDSLAIPLPSPSPEPGEGGSGAQVRDPTLTQIMDNIKSYHASLSAQIETIRVDFALLKDDVHKIRHGVTNAEQRISEVKDDLNPLMVQMRDVTADHKSQEAKLGDIEEWLRRNNL